MTANHTFNSIKFGLSYAVAAYTTQPQIEFNSSQNSVQDSLPKNALNIEEGILRRSGENAPWIASNTDEENTATACADGIDNDGDGLIDCDDPECQELNDNIGCSTCFNDGLSFADEVLDYFNNCSNNTNTDSSDAIGAPDGPSVSLGNGGYVTLLFSNNTLTNSGNSDPDLFVFEVGPLVEASTIELRPQDDATETILIDAGIEDVDEDGFYEFGGIGGSTASVDIDSFFDDIAAGSVFFDAIKVVDVPGNCSTSSPGADIDAVCALSSVPCDIGGPCDDEDETTENDVFDSNCECAGTSIYDCPELNVDNGDPCEIEGEPGEYVDCTCLPTDCNGTPGGSATEDDCGVCDDNPDNDNTTCAALVDGVVNSQALCIESGVVIHAYEPGTSNLIENVNATVDINGNFAFEITLPGAYDLFIKVDGHLRDVYADITLNTGSNDLGTLSFIAGDINNDNSINIQDFSLFSTAYGFNEDDDAFNPLADLNCDGVISIPDFSLFSSGFPADGVPLPENE
ncbi:MAG: hypothetical protein LC664_01105 [Flavobacteriales bacterium]|nr:hypothetical protein [Flavobacteriales bacterium]